MSLENPGQQHDSHRFSRFLSELRAAYPELAIVGASERRQLLASNTIVPDLLLKLDALELDRRCKQNEPWLKKATALIAELSLSMTAFEYVMACSDANGILLYSAGSPPWRAVLGILPGYDWSERQMGPNGIGTSLIERRPLAIVGLHHYQLHLGRTCCFAVPIADDANILGSMELRISAEDSTLERVGSFLAGALALLKA